MIHDVKAERRSKLPSGSRDPSFWLLLDGGGPEPPLGVPLPDGGEALAVFSSEEEARMFCLLGDARPPLRVRETSSGEIVSLLYGPRTASRCVALDPPPEMLGRRLLSLLTIDRDRFARRFVGPVEGSARA